MLLFSFLEINIALKTKREGEGGRTGEKEKGKRLRPVKKLQRSSNRKMLLDINTTPMYLCKFIL